MNQLGTTNGFFHHGMMRISAVSPLVAVADPVACAKHCVEAMQIVETSHVVLLPELALGGYTCGDLFGQRSLLGCVVEAIELLCAFNRKRGQLMVVGAPLVVGDALMNTGIVIGDGKIIAAVPKQYLPNYREFYEARHFQVGDEKSPTSISVGRHEVPFGVDLIIQWGEAKIAIEICEDLWVPVPPSSLAAIAGANVLLNLSSSNETIGKASWRRELVTSQSGRCIAAYAYASSGPTESSTDLVFGGHCLIAENGRLVRETARVGGPPYHNAMDTIRICTADIDLQRIQHDRRITGTFHQASDFLKRPYRTITIRFDPKSETKPTVAQGVTGQPFIPGDDAELRERCAEILAIQSAGLAKRISRLPKDLPLVIGVSGGLDSTLALMVAVATLDANGWPRDRILGINMPGFGTTTHTRRNADELMKALGIKQQSIDIRPLAMDTFLAMGHRPMGIEIDERSTVDSLQAALVKTPDGINDLAFENVQARLRTFLLMSHGFVLGTGDMSEQALGWCTYNADHMSMYNVNTSIPKTLVRFLIRHAAATHADEGCRDVLLRIAETVISPELLPPDLMGNIRQSTEDSVGTYELHDFFLYHIVRNGFDREKILFLASVATFSRPHTTAEVERTLGTFVNRFFANQFKRSCVPDGPKVGSVSLSPRGDWRMPSDAEGNAF